ncbi:MULTISPECIES: hypothetical protein [unclassified Paenibacillus]|uniref:hypothetical protein n=1 Tax=unclassified Paenibacillus TaxID=185978 RepID=UPI0009A5D2AE|nr:MULTISPECIES: hypothetical protein [unclassified Paenibacillus]SLK09110.1 hypothetical protein SAMN06272722_10618 [Paenibacillus sp. RU5A]SOC71399.1 hypothetical protein SAMN05880581_10618 [Paenibacillus sp. RU26A]SOC73846.1 hypothetical protein SAMN05880586_10618 [Paenibacillus sp. RU5M]
MSGFELKFRMFSKLCTEDYLIRHANKGLYKRSLKELDNGLTVQYTWNEASVGCQLSDGTHCSLENTLDYWECSCPADNICKHVLISILYYQREHQTENTFNQGEAASSAELEPESGLVKESRFSWMVESDLAPLIKSYSSSLIEEVLFRLRYPEQIEVLEDSLLTLRLVKQEIEVSFTEEASLAKALCKVKQTAGNMAKLEALLRYRMQQGLNDTEAISGRVHDATFSLQTVRECRSMLTGLLKTGLARLPQSYMAQLETLAIAAHSGHLPDVERSLRGIQGELQLFFNRHVRFSMQSMLDRVSKLYLALQVLEQEKVSAFKQSQLIGSFRSKYYTVPELHLYGLGADAWETRSGYRGITYYFYCFDDAEIYTYSDVRAVYYEDNQFSYTEHYGSFTPWLPNLTFRQFSGEEVQFRSVKVNEEYRLSSGEGAKLTLLPRTSVEEVNLGKYMQDIPSLLAGDARSFELFSVPKERLAMIKVARVVEHRFDKQSQDFILTMASDHGETLDLTLPYSTEWETMIKRLESGYGTGTLENFYAFVHIEQQRIYPISFLKGPTVISLKLDTGYGRTGRIGRL